MIGSPRDRLYGLGWAAAAIAIWSGSLVMLRLGVTTGLNAYDLAALRFGVAALLLAPIVLRHGFGIDRLGLAGLAIVVAGFGAPYVVLISLALRTAPASAAGSLNPGVMAVASVVLGWVVLGDRIGPVRAVGAALVLVGCLVAATVGGGVSVGHTILVGTGVMWAGYALTVRRAGISALHATAVVAVCSALIYLPIYALLLPKAVAHAPFGDVLWQAAFQGVLVSTVAVFAFNRSAELLGPMTGATLPALIPLVTLGLGAATLGEPAGPSEIVSAALISAGVLLILTGRDAMRWVQGVIFGRHRSAG